MDITTQELIEVKIESHHTKDAPLLVKNKAKEFARLKRMEKKLADRLLLLKLELLEYAGGHAIVYFKQEKLYTVKDVTRETIDCIKLKDELPKVYDEYLKQTVYKQLHIC